MGTEEPKDAIWAALRDVMDPELGVNIVDLGLVYGVDIDGGAVRVTMTMTSPACPMRDYLEGLVESAVTEHVSDVRSVVVDIVEDPPWSPDLMSEAARRQLE
jgi:metal-sulfur cluster biosynthetic enzyme